jgi:hypothetical protein
VGKKEEPERNNSKKTRLRTRPGRRHLTGINRIDRIDRINAQILDMFLSCSSCASL